MSNARPHLSFFRLRFVLLVAPGPSVCARPVEECSSPVAEAVLASTKQMAVTIDDLPVASIRKDLATHRDITDRLLETLSRAGLPAIGFVNENKLLTDGKLDPERIALLERWLDAGLELGNHSYSHPDLHRVGLEDFKADVLRGETVLRQLLLRRGARPRYFRHPFLHTGRDLETKRALEEFLREIGYNVAPVTINNSEWMFALAYDRAHDRGDRGLKQKISRTYVEYMDEELTYYEMRAEKLFGRPIRHVLLLHANRLNADHLGALLDRFRSAGYTFTSLDAALEDPAYGFEDRYTGREGMSWIHRWACACGVDPSFFAGWPVVPEFVRREAGVDSE